jgi:thioredoxin reductase (NADPH)
LTKGKYGLQKALKEWLANAERVVVAGIGNPIRTDNFVGVKIVQDLKDIASKKNVQVLWNTEVREIKGEKLVNKVVLFDNKAGKTKELAVDAVFVQVGEAPNSQLAKESGVEVDEHGYIKIDIFQRTSVPGVYAAGDVTNHPVKQVGTAVGQGITAALEAYGYIRRPYYRK